MVAEVEFWGWTVVFVVEFWTLAVVFVGNGVVCAGETVALACVVVRFWPGVVNNGTV